MKQIPAYADDVPAARGGVSITPTSDSAESSLDLVEQIDAGVRRLHDDVATQLLKRLREQHPASSSSLSWTSWLRWDTAESNSAHAGSAEVAPEESTV